MFFNIDYAKRAAAREKNSTNIQSLVITSIADDDDDDDFDYEQLFDDYEIKKPVKRVRFAPVINENSLTPTLSRPSSVRPRFEVEFDFDSLPSPSNELNKDSSNLTQKTMENMQWKDAFLSDLHIAKKNQPTVVSSPSITQIENKTNNDTLWDFVKEANPELLEKLERTNNEKQKRVDRFSTQQSPATSKINVKVVKPIPVPEKEGIRKTI